MKLLSFILISISFIACSNHSQKQEWIVSDVRNGHDESYFYRSVFIFSDDAINIDFLGSQNIAIPLKKSSQHLIENDSLFLKYQKYSDSIIVNIALGKSDTSELKLIPFKSSQKHVVSKSNLVKQLFDNDWSISYGESTFEITFLKSRFSTQALNAELQFYYNELYQRRLENAVWNIDSIQSQMVLILETTQTLNHHPKALFIDGFSPSNGIDAHFFKDGESIEVQLSRNDLIRLDELNEKKNSIIGLWSIISAFFPGDTMPDRTDATVIDLGGLPISKSLSKDLFIAQPDLFNAKIYIEFSKKGKLNIFKNDKIILTTNYKISRNGKMVLIEGGRQNREENNFTLEDFQFDIIDNDSITLEGRLPLYETDTTLREKYSQLYLNKTMHNNR